MLESTPAPIMVLVIKKVYLDCVLRRGSARRVSVSMMMMMDGGRGETYSTAAGASLAAARDGSAARGASAVAVVDGLHLV